MSIINDALKKAQEAQALNQNSGSNPGYLYSNDQAAPAPQGQPPIEFIKPPKEKRAKSVLSLIFAVALIVASFFFLYRQINTYYPRFFSDTKAHIVRLLHRNPKEKDLKPLARITTVIPAPAATPLKAATPPSAAQAPAAPQAAHAGPQQPSSPPKVMATIASQGPVTLNVHGVMSNGTSNVVLINDSVYQEGDSPVDGVKIIKISLDSITVSENGEEKTIRVKH